MTSERFQRQIERLLDEAADATSLNDWDTVRQRANAALTFDSENTDAQACLLSVPLMQVLLTLVLDWRFSGSPQPTSRGHAFSR
jgi:hypothetical protein